jgi:hypothetical protein
VWLLLRRFSRNSLPFGNFFERLLYPIGSKHWTKNVESTGKILFAPLSKLWLSTNFHETPNYCTVLRGAPVSDFTQIGQDMRSTGRNPFTPLRKLN